IAFDGNLQRREQLYQDADARREESFRFHESKRDAIFQEGQHGRANMYVKEEQDRAERADWYENARASVLSEGRQTRENICKDVKESLEEKFAELAKIQEANFISKESERDAIIQKLCTCTTEMDRLQMNESLGMRDLLAPLNTSSSKMDHELRPAIRSSPTTVWQPKMPPIPPQPPLLPFVGVVIDPLSPYPVMPPSPRQPKLIRFVPAPSRSVSLGSSTSGRVHRGESTELSNRHQSSTLRFPSPETNPVVLSQAEKISYPDTETEKRIDKRFMAAQRRRSLDFADQESSRVEHFEAFEADRNVAEAKRSHEFEEMENSCQNLAQLMFDRHNTHYRIRDETRKETCQGRMKIYHVTQKRFEQGFTALLQGMQTQTDAEHRFEQDLDLQRKSGVEEICQRRRKLLKEARDGMQRRFIAAQSRWQIALKIGPLSPRIEEQPQPRLPHVWLGRHRVPNGSSSYSAPSQTRAPTVLLKRPETMDALPVPMSKVIQDVAIIQEVPAKESDFLVLQKRHEILFRRSQSHREEVFELAMEARSRTFTINEQRRVSDFEVKQRSRRVAFDSQEDGHKRRFNELQEKRDLEFLNAEREQERVFHDDEVWRSHDFQQEQTSRFRRFDAKQQEWQTKLFAQEKIRLLDVRTWASELLESFESETRRAYESEEAKWEEAFQALLMAFREKKYYSQSSSCSA
ncbi:hypothetical protein H0H93_011239, partial [Arthromyces matolae]